MAMAGGLAVNGKGCGNVRPVEIRDMVRDLNPELGEEAAGSVNSYFWVVTLLLC
jgi:hypothetical protein